MAVTYNTPTNLQGFIQGSFGAQSDTIALTRLSTGVAIQVTGTWTGTITFQATVDGANWVAFNMTPSDSGTDASTTTGNGAWSKQINGFAQVRAIFTTKSSGTPVVTIRGNDQK